MDKTIECDSGSMKLNLPNSASTSILGKGVVIAKSIANGDAKVVNLSYTLYVLDLCTNLISIRKITDKGHSVRFDRTDAKVIDR